MVRSDFNVELVTEKLIQWIKEYFENNGNPQTKAVIGISGGKDSSIAAALCVKALGRSRVLGVLMPNGEQEDIDDSYRICKHLGIDYRTINMIEAYSSLSFQVQCCLLNPGNSISDMEINLAPRLRMTTLYAVAQALPAGGRVVNTCNLSEDYIGYSTKYGDAAGDFSPLGNLTVSEILKIGDYLGLPYELVHKVPSDGLCGVTDEDRFGFTYEQLDTFICNGKLEDSKVEDKIKGMHRTSRHKYCPMPTFVF